MFVKILNLFKASLIVCLSIRSSFNNLIEQEAIFYIPIGKLVDTLYDKEQQEILPFSINILNYYCLFPIARLYEFTSSISISMYNYYRGIDNTYYKAYLVKVIEVVIKNTIFSLYILYKGKLLTNEFRVFIEGSLKVIDTIKYVLSSSCHLIKSSTQCFLICLLIRLENNKLVISFILANQGKNPQVSRSSIYYMITSSSKSINFFKVG